MWAAVLLAVCALCAGPAYGQVTAQFWVVTDLGNSYELDGPPPDRPPGFDTAPYLNVHRMDTVLAIHAGPAPGVDPVAFFGEAGVVTPLPPHDPGRSEMSATVVTDWRRHAHSQPLWAPMPVGELRMHGGAPYLGPARVGDLPVLDLLSRCNAGAAGRLDVKCVDNRTGRNLTAANHTLYGHMLDMPGTGRTIIHVDNGGPTAIMEVVFTCPECRDVARAFHGLGGNTFLGRGFNHPTALAAPAPPYRFEAGNLTGLAWDHTSDSNGITYWQDGGACTPTLSIGGGMIHGACPGIPIQGGTVNARGWQPLVPGWNRVDFYTGDSYLIISDPGAGAKLQARQGTAGCCIGFDGHVWHLAREPGRPAGAAVFHDTDRHLLVIPYGGSVPNTHPALQHMQDVRFAAREEPRLALRQLAHSDPGDTPYHGLFYDDGGVWPPYMVRLVESRNVQFDWPALDILRHTSVSEYTQDDMRRVLDMRTAGGLMDSEIYDIRNGVLLRQDEGRFAMWDRTHIHRPYIEPWMHVAKNPVWETFGVKLPEDAFVVVDMYATIPVVKPTRLASTYISGIPCGDPGPGERDGARNAVLAAAAAGGYDAKLIEFLLYADWDGAIHDSMILQQIYLASRTYLDYIDGEYAAGDRIHIPVLPGRPYLCTTVAPNILESQYMLYGLPFGESYMSLGGTEAFADIPGSFGAFPPTTYEHNTGVQSPRDGIISLDVAARFGAAVAALGMGDASPSRLAHTGQWGNGTARVDATLSAGATTVHLGSFGVDTYDIAEETYHMEGGQCYGRFVTMPDHSHYITRTISTPASLGEHIPVTLSVTVSNHNMTSSAICDLTTAESLVVQFLLETFAVDVR